jgi:hypothetical protein
MFGVVLVVLVSLLGGYVARREAAHREAAQRLARALSRAVAPLDATLTGEALSPGETPAAHLLAILAVVRYRLTKAGAQPYVAPPRAELLRGREEEPPELRERRDARRALVRDPAFCALAQTCDRLDVSGASPRTAEAGLSLVISSAMDALVIAVYRARYQGSGALCALHQRVERFRDSLEEHGTGLTPRAVAKARGKGWERRRRAQRARRRRGGRGSQRARAALASVSEGRRARVSCPA